MSTNKKTKKNKRKKSQIVVFIHSMQQVATKISRAAGDASTILIVKVKAGWHRFWRMPRIFRIVSVYLLTVLFAGGIFLWSINRLRLVEPYSMEESPFEWATYRAEADKNENPEINSPAEAENEGHIGEIEVEPEPVAAEPPEEQTVENAVWPIKGELFYAYNQMVKDEGLGSPLYYFSKGIAIKADAGKVIVAVWSGRVIQVSEKDKPHGCSVMLEHDNGCITYYGALGGFSVKKGDIVTQGQVIGEVGPGYDTEPDYLYLEMTEDGRTIDPEQYLP